MATRNMQRIEINLHEKELCVKLFIYKDYFCHILLLSITNDLQQNVMYKREVATKWVPDEGFTPE
jgi:hypothetical protein